MTSATAAVDPPLLAANSIKLPLAASVVGGLLLGVVLTFGLRALDDSEAQTAAALTSANAALTETSKELERADRLADLKQAGATAVSALPASSESSVRPTTSLTSATARPQRRHSHPQWLRSRRSRGSRR